MADQYGVRGGLVSPRVHLPVRSPRSVASPPDPVTLLQPRPDVQRVANEYVETPLRPPCESVRTSVSSRHHHTHTHTHTKRAVVTDQPTHHQTFKKESHSGSGSASTAASAVDQCSIICRECGRCRCDACRQPRPVPSFWLCRNLCLCSTQSCVDVGSCLCCVKGLMYHCASRDGDDDTCADDPCSCGPHRRLGRWTCLAFTSLALPCLCCYWPLKGLASVAESCYERCTARGCRCHHSPAPATAHDKRLLPLSHDT